MLGMGVVVYMYITYEIIYFFLDICAVIKFLLMILVESIAIVFICWSIVQLV